MINHAISFLMSPLAVALALIACGLIISAIAQHAHRSCPAKRPSRSFPTCFLRLFSSSTLGCCLILVGIVYLCVLSTDLASRGLGLLLEREFPPQRVEELPMADAIVILGGGMGGNTNTVHYPELYAAADRVVHAARLWKAGKAPVVMASGSNELIASVPFLLELGVPRSAILVENKSGNTEENARFVAATLAHREKVDEESGARVLLVTSAWHMRRSLLMFRKYAPELEIIPAACDYEVTLHADDFRLVKLLLPNADSLLRNSYALKEIVGYWGYRILR